MGKRRQARELALQALYRLDLNPGPPETALAEAEGYSAVPEEARQFARHIVIGVRERLGEIDPLLEKASLRWGLARMAVVDRNVMRMAAYELLADPATPVRVVLNEAIDLAKAFGGDESGTFVNGILDRVRIDLGREAG